MQRFSTVFIVKLWLYRHRYYGKSFCILFDSYCRPDVTLTTMRKYWISIFLFSFFGLVFFNFVHEASLLKVSMKKQKSLTSIKQAFSYSVLVLRNFWSKAAWILLNLDDETLSFHRFILFKSTDQISVSFKGY